MNEVRGLILAAGSSQRLHPLTNAIPKTLLPLKGRTILDHIVGACLRAGLQKLSLVTGHGHERVQVECERIRERHPDCRFSFIHCAEYSSRGNVHSLHVARELFQQPLVLINSDLVFAHEILQDLLASRAPTALVIDDHKTLGLEEMKVAVENGRVTAISKNLNPATSDGEYIGMTKLSPASAGQLEEALRHVSENAPHKYYEDAFQHAMSEGTIDFHKVSTRGAPCMEIDTLEDLALARENAHLWQ